MKFIDQFKSRKEILKMLQEFAIGIFIFSIIGIGIRCWVFIFHFFINNL